MNGIFTGSHFYWEDNNYQYESISFWSSQLNINLVTVFSLMKTFQLRVCQLRRLALYSCIFYYNILQVWAGGSPWSPLRLGKLEQFVLKPRCHKLTQRDSHVNPCTFRFEKTRKRACGTLIYYCHISLHFGITARLEQNNNQFMFKKHILLNIVFLIFKKI